MPRNSSGVYSLYTPGNPVVTNTAISSTWANNTLADLATAITDSLSRSGDGGMLAPLELDNGVVGAPGLTFGSETTTGLYLAGAGDARFAVGGTDVLSIAANLVGVSGTAPEFRFNETDAAANNRVWDFSVASEQLRGRVGSDALSFVNWLTVDRTANVVDAVTLLTTSLELESSAPLFLMDETDAAANERNWLLRSVAGDFFLSTATDAAPTTAVASPLSFTRTGTTVDSIALAASAVSVAAPLTLTGALTGPTASSVLMSSARPGILWNETDAAANNRLWGVEVQGEQLLLEAFSDAGTAVTIMSVDRTANTIDTIALASTNMTFTGTLFTLTGAGQRISSSAPILRFNETDAAADNRLWFIDADTEQFNIGIEGDASGFANAVTIDRTGASTIDKINLQTPLLQAQGIHNGTAPTGTNNYIASGTYTPTITNVTNVSSSTARVCQWIRVGRVVTVGGTVSVTPTGAAARTAIGISLPVASNLANASELGGGGGAQSGATNTGMWIFGDTTNDRAAAEWTSVSAGSIDHSFTFTYLVN